MASLLAARGLLLALAGSVAGCASTSSPPPPVAPKPPLQTAASAPSPCADPEWPFAAERLELVDPARAKALLRSCLAGSSAPPSAWRLLADLEAEDGELQRARQTLLRAVATHPEDAFAWAALGRIEDASGRGDLALGAFARARRLRPDHEGLALEHARALRLYGSEAERTGARLAPLFAEADGRAELGDLRGALSTLELAAMLAEGRPAALARVELRRAVVHLAAGAIEEGLAASARGLAQLGTGEEEPALRAELWVVAAEARLVRGEHEQAVLAARAARRHAPAHPLASTNLALALLRLGDRAGARRAVSEALEQGLSRRLDAEAFLGLEGIRELVRSAPELTRAVEAAWPEARAALSAPGPR